MCNILITIIGPTTLAVLLYNRTTYLALGAIFNVKLDSIVVIVSVSKLHVFTAGSLVRRVSNAISHCWKLQIVTHVSENLIWC